jgi:hypothetical protein
MSRRVGRWLTGQPFRAVSRIQMLTCAVVLSVPLASSSEARATALSWPSSLQSALALTLQTGADQAGLTSTACWSSNSCIAVGEDDVSGAERAIVVPEVAGVPGQAVAVKLPALAQTGSSEVATLNGVSCSSDGACVAVGEYEDTSGVTDALVVPITGGVPSTGLEVMPPGASGESYLSGVSCPATGTCVAVGTYGVDSNSYQEGVVVPINDGVPGAAAEVSPPSNADTGAPSVSANSVSCWSHGSCVAAGQYQTDPSNGAVYPMVVRISGGVPAAGLEVKLPGDAYPDTAEQQSVLGSVSCQPPGSCVAVGSYVDTSGGSRPLVVATSGDVPSAAREVSLPARAGGGADDAGLTGVSCHPSGSCSAVGSYVDAGGNGEPLVVPLVRGVAAAALEGTLPANALPASTGDQDGSLNAVSCPASGSCVAVGDYYDASDEQQGLVVPVTGGAPRRGNEAALQPSETANPSASLAAVSCAVSGSCVAIGQHDDATGQPSSVAYSLQTPLSISASRLPGTKVGAVYQATLAATGGWGMYTWSVASGRLPGGLSLNAQTGVISGRSMTPASRKPTFRATGTGDPAQTVIKALTIPFDGPVLTVFLGRGGTKLSGSDVRIRVSCSNAACRGSLKLVYTHEVTLSHHKREREQTVIGSAGYSLSAGRSRTVTVKLSAAGLTFLQGAKNQRLAVVLAVTVRGGESTLRDTAIIAATTKTRRQR